MTATAVVGRSRELVDPALRAAVSRLDADTRLVTSYHLGWNDAEGHPVDASGGKAVRPGLLMLVGEALGGSPQDLLAGAVAVELVHNFSLIHDDLMDRDTERRHRATVWSVWGDATAVLVGDALLSLAHEVLAETGSEYAAAAARSLSVATRELIRGQVLDVAFERRDDVTMAECLDMAAGKTGSLLSASAELGALLSGAPVGVTAAFAQFGAQVGIAFQLVDDLLGIWGWPDRTGKPVFSDLRSRKKTLPVVWATTHASPAGRELATWLADTAPDPTEADLRHAADLVDRAGGRRWACDEALARVDRARRALAGVGLDPEHRDELDRLASFVVERDL